MKVTVMSQIPSTIKGKRVQVCTQKHFSDRSDGVLRAYPPVTSNSSDVQLSLG